MDGMMQMKQYLINLNKLSTTYSRVFNKDKYWIVANTLGVVLYIFLASLTWPTIEQLMIPLWGRTESDERFLIHFLGQLPLIISFFFVNIAWIIKIVVDLFTEGFRKSKSWMQLFLWLIICLAWICTVSYDRFRSIQEI